ncbi:MAG TPA: type IV secretion protein Rhs, partial [Enterobacteriaceae bacterium]|nr:type IV secretion protein Rhs [Enterobacteriaceae bacterium]
QPNGTPECLTDAEGRVCQEAQNSAWGKLLHERDAQLLYAQNLRMQGQYLDRETGLHYNLFRYYDPDCGRFTQQDPIGLAGGLNLYSYAPNPLSWIDPFGLKCGDADSSKAYSTAYEMKLSKASYPGVSRGRHFQEANESLLKVIESDQGFADNMRKLDVNIERTPTGLAPRKPPESWTWHHELSDGTMRLVPRFQHTPGSNFWNALHPDGYGGYAIWGK